VSITTSRNYFGRQKESFVADLFIVDEKLKHCMDNQSNNIAEMKIADLRIDDFIGDETFPGIFIRAPGIVAIDDPDKIEILSTLQIGMADFVPVAVKQNNLMVTSFHPELTQDLRFHKFFVENILQRYSI
jgi:5'-phosphate synthase pdxT subunit